jgi:peptidoglycan hydrolase-like protein with peptidoglycan-binding domain
LNNFDPLASKQHHPMRHFVLFSALTLVAVAGAMADDQVKSAQETLKAQGFYTGPVDGELNPDTGKAIRRFQIRSGIDATGKLDEATVKALNESGAPSAPESNATPEPVAPPPPQTAPSTPANPPPAAPSQEQDNYLRNMRPQGAAPVQPRTGTVPARPGGDAAFARLYDRTPFSNAPREVQVDTLRKAQSILVRSGLYSGPVDGRPSPDFEEALVRYQSKRDLPRTGRMDIDTLAQMHLLPVSRIPLKPFHGGAGAPPQRGPVRGVEVPVRGIEVD